MKLTPKKLDYTEQIKVVKRFVKTEDLIRAWRKRNSPPTRWCLSSRTSPCDQRSAPSRRQGSDLGQCWQPDSIPEYHFQQHFLRRISKKATLFYIDKILWKWNGLAFFFNFRRCLWMWKVLTKSHLLPTRMTGGHVAGSTPCWKKLKFRIRS